MKRADIVIVGAGLQAITLMIALERMWGKGKVIMIDPKAPLQNWFQASEGQGGMEYMRTGWTHHVEAGKPKGLEETTFRSGLQPTRRQFNEHARQMLEAYGLKRHHYQGAVEDIIPGKTPKAQLEVIYHGDDGNQHQLTAKRVVVSTGLGVPMVPGGMRTDNERVFHSANVDLTSIDWEGEYVAIVGRGQSAATMAAHLADNGVTVSMIMRGALGSDQLEADHEFLPGSGYRYRNFQYISDVAERAEIVAGARKGRGVTPDVYQRVDAHHRARRVDYLENSNVIGWERSGDRVHVQQMQGDSFVWTGPFDRVVFCTGFEYSVEKLGFLDPMLEHVETAGGLPVLDHKLRVPTAPRLGFMGRGAELQIGPLGRNLPGAIEGCKRVLGGLGVPGMDQFHASRDHFF